MTVIPSSCQDDVVVRGVCAYLCVCGRERAVAKLANTYLLSSLYSNHRKQPCYSLTDHWTHSLRIKRRESNSCEGVCVFSVGRRNSPIPFFDFQLNAAEAEIKLNIQYWLHHYKSEGWFKYWRELLETFMTTKPVPCRHFPTELQQECIFKFTDCSGRGGIWSLLQQQERVKNRTVETTVTDSLCTACHMSCCVISPVDAGEMRTGAWRHNTWLTTLWANLSWHNIHLAWMYT